MKNYISGAVNELYSVFDILNKKYYGNSLPYPVITIQTNNNKSVAGWFTLNKVWQKEDNKAYEINICAERLKDGAIMIAETLNHEMVHYANKLAEIVDSHNYVHTTKFKTLAESVDLICEKTKKYGWGFTSPSESFISFIKDKVDESKFSYFRDSSVVKVKRAKTLFKYCCPKCGSWARSKKNVSLFCGECSVSMEMEI